MKKSINDLKLKNKKVIMRVDFNVPVKEGVITSNKRILAALPTISKVVEEGGKLILLSHLGRVKEQADLKKNTLYPVAIELARLIGKPVHFVDKTRGIELEIAVNKLEKGEILLVQNTRFEDLNEKAESKNNPELAKYWASLADVYINDAFGAAHRAHASTAGIAEYVKESALGYLMNNEVEKLSKLLNDSEKPFVAIIGGAKVSDKIKVLENLVTVVDKILIGGGMAYTFKKALGFEVGSSLLEQDYLEFAKDFMEKYSDKVLLPIDDLCAREFADVEPIYQEGNIEQGLMGLDIGPKTIKLFAETLKDAKTVFWNGPMGVTEFNNFTKGTLAVAEAIAELQGKAYSVVGGGDSVAAVQKLKMVDSFSHVSTGGGASLELIEGKKLPGIEAIQDK
ncbi:Phosphoglycerate kinase [Mycoplasmopsis maculosa]|uniref:Phosphoglycerate kinase n=1 Tax=Mycoplasmopsis maculosa TaxID=114885 RepID=A0A449B414_9BACT|nr:phosphoglycerate kinase [Mycoplasmopsis maculosa]VEU75343.1 Phosphoglycerate kinase [Mycoplasmopsis maculosa]